MKRPGSKESATRRGRVISLLALLLCVAFFGSACGAPVTGLDHAFCESADFSTFGPDDEEDLYRCLQRGVPISGNVTAR
jgi:hypothetical protein